MKDNKEKDDDWKSLVPRLQKVVMKTLEKQLFKQPKKKPLEDLLDSNNVTETNTAKLQPQKLGVLNKSKLKGFLDEKNKKRRIIKNEKSNL